MGDTKPLGKPDQTGHINPHVPSGDQKPVVSEHIEDTAGKTVEARTGILQSTQSHDKRRKSTVAANVSRQNIAPAGPQKKGIIENIKTLLAGRKTTPEVVIENSPKLRKSENTVPLSEKDKLRMEIVEHVKNSLTNIKLVHKKGYIPAYVDVMSSVSNLEKKLLSGGMKKDDFEKAILKVIKDLEHLEFHQDTSMQEIDSKELKTKQDEKDSESLHNGLLATKATIKNIKLLELTLNERSGLINHKLLIKCMIRPNDDFIKQMSKNDLNECLHQINEVKSKLAGPHTEELIANLDSISTTLNDKLISQEDTIPDTIFEVNSYLGKMLVNRIKEHPLTSKPVEEFEKEEQIMPILLNSLKEAINNNNPEGIKASLETLYKYRSILAQLEAKLKVKERDSIFEVLKAGLITQIDDDIQQMIPPAIRDIMSDEKQIETMSLDDLRNNIIKIKQIEMQLAEELGPDDVGSNELSCNNMLRTKIAELKKLRLSIENKFIIKENNVPEGDLKPNGILFNLLKERLNNSQLLVANNWRDDLSNYKEMMLPILSDLKECIDSKPDQIQGALGKLYKHLTVLRHLEESEMGINETQSIFEVLVATTEKDLDPARTIIKANSSVLSTLIDLGESERKSKIATMNKQTIDTLKDEYEKCKSQLNEYLNSDDYTDIAESGETFVDAFVTEFEKTSKVLDTIYSEAVTALRTKTIPFRTDSALGKELKAKIEIFSKADESRNPILTPIKKLYEALAKNDHEKASRYIDELHSLNRGLLEDFEAIENSPAKGLLEIIDNIKKHLELVDMCYKYPDAYLLANMTETDRNNSIFAMTPEERENAALEVTEYMDALKTHPSNLRDGVTATLNDILGKLSDPMFNILHRCPLITSLVNKEENEIEKMLVDSIKGVTAEDKIKYCQRELDRLETEKAKWYDFMEQNQGKLSSSETYTLRKNEINAKMLAFEDYLNNLTDKLTIDNLLEKTEKYFQKLQQSSNAKREQKRTIQRLVNPTIAKNEKLFEDNLSIIIKNLSLAKSKLVNRKNLSEIINNIITIQEEFQKIHQLITEKQRTEIDDQLYIILKTALKHTSRADLGAQSNND